MGSCTERQKELWSRFGELVFCEFPLACLGSMEEGRMDGIHVLEDL